MPVGTLTVHVRVRRLWAVHLVTRSAGRIPDPLAIWLMGRALALLRVDIRQGRGWRDTGARFALEQC